MKKASLLRWTAFHEAGHAVLRIIRTGVATAIDTGPDGSGLSHGSLQTFRALDCIEIALAGPIAESRVRKVSLASVLLTSGAQDWKEATTLATQIAQAGFDSHSILADAERNARRQLGLYWVAVQRVAAEAAMSGRLTAERVKILANVQ